MAKNAYVAEMLGRVQNRARGVQGPIAGTGVATGVRAGGVAASGDVAVQGWLDRLLGRVVGGKNVRTTKLVGGGVFATILLDMLARQLIETVESERGFGGQMKGMQEMGEAATNPEAAYYRAMMPVRESERRAAQDILLQQLGMTSDMTNRARDEILT